MTYLYSKVKNNYRKSRPNQTDYKTKSEKFHPDPLASIKSRLREKRRINLESQLPNGSLDFPAIKPLEFEFEKAPRCIKPAGN